MSISPETITDFLSEHGKIYHKNNKINMRCPLCNDSKKSPLKKRFTVFYSNGEASYSCFNCGKSGTFAELYAELRGISLSEAIRSVNTNDFNKIRERLTPKADPIPNEPEATIIFNNITNDCININSEPKGYIERVYKEALLKFIHERKIPEEYQQQIFVAIEGEYKGRIIIPIYESGNIVYFQARLIGEGIRKYDNPHVKKGSIFMNREYFKGDKYIIVTEGIIDAMMVEDHQGIPVLGADVKDLFLDELYRYTDMGVIIAVDNDERGKIERNNIIKNSKYVKQLKFFIPENKKDLNELVIGGLTKVYDFVTSNSFDYWTYLIKNNLS